MAELAIWKPVDHLVPLRHHHHIHHDKILAQHLTPLGKVKHGAYKIWHRNVDVNLRMAYDAIYGLSLYGSLSFAALSTPAGQFINIQSRISERFKGPSTFSSVLHCGPDNSTTIDLTVSSAGKDDGDLATIVVDKVNHCTNGRGINVVVVDWSTGTVADVQCFDTHGSPTESTRFQQFVDNVAINMPGHIVLGAIRDDGAKFLTHHGRAALLSLGVILPVWDNEEQLARVVDKLPVNRCAVLLTVCAKSNAARCADLLLSHGWPVGYRAAHTNNTPLHDAAYQCNTDVAQVLLAHGADTDVTNRWNESPNDIAHTRHAFSCLDDMILVGSEPIQSVIRFLDL